MEKFRPLSAICGRTVVDARGEPVGLIHDVLLNVREGRVEYVCIALIRDDDAEAAEAVVPWSVLRMNSEEGASWRIAASRAVLEDIAQPMLMRP